VNVKTTCYLPKAGLLLYPPLSTDLHAKRFVPRNKPPIIKAGNMWFFAMI
jgi:hypothetical protein